MKKAVLVLLSLTLVFSLCGCSLLSQIANPVSTLKDWSFQYNSSTKDYSVFFAFYDKNDKAVASDATVEIRIVDNKGNKLYTATKKVLKSDFATYTNKAGDEQYLAEIRIPEFQVAEGLSASGTVFLKIYKDNVFEFDEVNCTAFYCLPVKPATLTIENLPLEIELKYKSGNIASKLVIEEVTYSYDGVILPSLDINISVKKTYGNNSSIDEFSYKLYDGKGYLVDSGTVSLSDLETGDRILKTIHYYDAVPGEEYTIKFAPMLNESGEPLPVKSVTVTAEKLPFEIVLKDYRGKIESKITIEEVSYTYKSWLEISLSGTKTYGDTSIDMFGYKIYDSQGYMVDSGGILLTSLSKGDKFKNEDITFFDAVPGEEYTIKFVEKWY